MAVRAALSWKQLGAMTKWTRDYERGSACSQSTLRLFGAKERDVRVTLYRDNHAWCPYCQKVWLFLEEKQIPYRAAKVTMRCYGPKEKWYLQKVPNGMLPALELDGLMITESDDILARLEAAYGPLGMPMAKITPYRQLERDLFRGWCQWLCYPARSANEEGRNKKGFESVLEQVNQALNKTKGPFFLEEFSLADVIFIPYAERMLSSLYYYKGFDMKQQAPNVKRWFEALEGREAYVGTQSDAHTHCHDLPPQMGGCYESGDAAQQACKARVDHGPWEGLLDCGFAKPANVIEEALARTVKHKDNLITANCLQDKAKVDEAIRRALMTLVGTPCEVQDKDSAIALLYIRDRINVPRDMSIHAARQMRAALTATAAGAGAVAPPPIPFDNRMDQQPAIFRTRLAGA